MRGAWIVAILLLLGCASAYSQPPTPAPSKAAAQHKQHARSENPDTAVSNPILASLYARIDELEAEVKAQKAENKAPSKWWPIGIAALTALAIIAQVFVYWRQTRIMNKALAATNSSIELARREFNLVHRPKLFARSFFPVCNVPGMPNRFHFSIYNDGDEEGVIKFDDCTFYATFDDGREWNNLLAEWDDLQRHSAVIRVGEEKRFKIVLKNSAVLSNYKRPGYSGLSARPGTEVRLRFKGNIVYLDKAGEIRHCPFDRTYDFQGERFVRVEDSEFERSG